MIVSCSKTGYRSQGEAKQVAARIAKGHRRMRVYRCPDCKQWHMTSGRSKMRPNALEIEEEIIRMEGEAS